MKETPRVTAVSSSGVALVYRVTRLLWNDSEYLEREGDGKEGEKEKETWLILSVPGKHLTSTRWHRLWPAFGFADPVIDSR